MLFFQSSVPAKKQYYNEAQYGFLTCEYQQETMSCSEESVHFGLRKSSTSLSERKMQILSASFVLKVFNF